MTPDNIAKNGKGVVCKACRKVSQEAWRQANPEKIKESAKRASQKFRRAQGVLPGSANARKTHCAKGHEYTEENTYWFGPDKRYRQCRMCRAEGVKASYRRHREKRLAWHKAWRETNGEQHREASRRWLRENRERANLTSRLKKQRRRAGGTLTTADWELVLDVYGRACLACGKAEVTIDHVIPVSAGGPNVASNVQPLCGYCNTSKGTRTADYRPFPWEDLIEQTAQPLLTEALDVHPGSPLNGSS